ncbi:MAG: ribosome recycling factor [Clostridia bacterium]|nr:ribosome recycling factor [Oscillospiraceae bacterium]MBQ6836375.1 ribosome recycling factor [Clostridia bacterium]MBQ6934358.1 ribosome recycling factor [Clostridia bacterium]MBQ7087399.1 ribosome recycling factor [Clostridia bacterium]MBQ7094215.1 ribosome recycling factor [Clostridia bacterium]
MNKDDYKVYGEKMDKTVAALKHEFTTIRAGRANPGVLDKITIEYFGSTMPINQIGSISVPEPRTLMIQPWDASAVKLIEKAILASDIGITPQNDGKVIRLNFPPLTEERRKELIKMVHKYGEEAKVAARNIRRDAMDKFKDMKKKSEITEDDLKDAEKEVQNMVDKICKEIDGEVAKKEKELSEI